MSKIHDYYDGLSDGSDKSLTFVRQPQDIQIPEPKSEYHKFYGGSELCDDRYKYDCTKHIVGFCGSVYPYILIVRSPRSAMDVSDNVITYCYDLKSFYEVIDDSKVFYNPRGHRFFRTLVNGQLGTKKQIELWLTKGVSRNDSDSVKTNKYLLDIFLKFRIPYYTITEQGGEFLISTYPVLTKLQFYKLFDAPTAIQRLEMYLNNELAPLDRMKILPIPDKIKAESHGFNKFSFRQDPSSNKRGKK